MRAGREVCGKAGDCGSRQLGVCEPGMKVQAVCVRTCRQEGFYLSELIMYIQKERVTFCCLRVQARTYYGARHGLETLSQMIAFDDSAESLTIYSTAQVRLYVLL